VSSHPEDRRRRESIFLTPLDSLHVRSTPEVVARAHTANLAEMPASNTNATPHPAARAAFPFRTSVIPLPQILDELMRHDIRNARRAASHHRYIYLP